MRCHKCKLKIFTKLKKTNSIKSSHHRHCNVIKSMVATDGWLTITRPHKKTLKIVKALKNILYKKIRDESLRREYHRITSLMDE